MKRLSYYDKWCLTQWAGDVIQNSRDMISYYATMILLILLTCSDAQELIDKVSVSQGVDRDSIVEVIKTTMKLCPGKIIINSIKIDIPTNTKGIKASIMPLPFVCYCNQSCLSF